jgi:hypothetical protein
LRDELIPSGIDAGDAFQLIKDMMEGGFVQDRNEDGALYLTSKGKRRMKEILGEGGPGEVGEKEQVQ